MKMLLINQPMTSHNKFWGMPCPLYGVPLNLCYTAKQIKESGNEAEILDLTIESIKKFGLKKHNKLVNRFLAKSGDVFMLKINFLFGNEKLLTNLMKEMIKRKVNEGYIIFGINGDIPSFTFFIAEQIKNFNKDSIVLVGGHKAIGMPLFFLENENIDAVLMGESERVISKLLKRLKQGRSLSDIKVLLPNKTKHIISPKKEDLLSGNEISAPPYEFSSFYDYYEVANSLAIISSRGCGRGCKFCGRNIRKTPRFSDPEKIVEKIEYLNKNYGIKNFSFYDSAMNLNIKHLEKLCDEIIERKLEIKWTCNCILKNLDRNVLLLMKRAGCTVITFGIESGSQRMLDMINKRIDLKQGEEILRECKEVGIRTRGTFIYDLPGEGWPDIFKTLKFIFKNRLDIFRFYPLYIDENSIMNKELQSKILHGKYRRRIRSKKESLNFLIKHSLFNYFLVFLGNVGNIGNFWDW